MKRTCLKCGLDSDDLTLFKASKRHRYGRANQCKDCWSLWSNHGMIKSEYEALENAQYGACAVCKNHSDTRLVVDHDHATGKVRGLLCNQCNVALGLFRDSKQALQNARSLSRRGSKLNT